ncbi:MAG TPA: PAS domain S-box protein [Flavisolibacter sp.]|nr:PAS domain S-box protein [Flavisolibacter sp.]
MIESLVNDVIPQNDVQRLNALKRYKILDTSPEESFDNITRLMAETFQMPIALISLVDKDQVFLKGNVGMPGVNYTDRNVSLCSYAILSPEPTVFNKPLEEPCLLANPLVHGDFGLRFYAGAPLTTPDGYHIGAVCIVDKEERTFSAAQQEMLVRFSKLVMHEIEMRHAVQKQAEVEAQLTAANEELQFVTDTMPQLVWATEANGYAYFFNKGWLDYTGLNLDDVKGDGWMQSLHPDDLERTADAWMHAYKDGAAYTIEYRLKRHDGAYRWFLTRGTPMKDSYGKILKWYGTTTDIHDQKQTEEALLQSKERFDLAAKATQDVIWDWDLTTNLIWWNEGFKTLFGYSEQEIEPTIDSWYNRVHPNDKERVVGGIHEVIDNGGKNWSAEYRFRKKDGSYAIVYDRGYALHDTKGQPYRMLGSMQDITEHKQAEQALRQSEERLQKALSIETVGVIYFDLDGVIHDANSAFEKMSGYSLEAIRSGSIRWDKVTPPEFMEVTLKSKEEFLTKGQNAPYEKQYIRPDGSRFWGLFAGKRLSDKECVEFVVDITKTKEAEEELERKVEERTIELAHANEALTKSNHELTRLNKNLEEFAYAASHDLKEPTRKIHVFSERLKDSLGERMTESEKKYFERMELASKRMSTLIDDLLLYSEVSQRSSLEEQVDMNFIIDCVVSDLDLQIEQKGATIEVDKLFTIKGHRRQLQQAFQNLISNALKYSKPDTPPVINISCNQVKGINTGIALSTEELATDFYQLTVSDNGIGFEQKDAERIFNVFTRLHGMAEYKGTGVGLSIVRKVIENHCGYIWAEGQPGEGATFKILLPHT